MFPPGAPWPSLFAEAKLPRIGIGSKEDDLALGRKEFRALEQERLQLVDMLNDMRGKESMVAFPGLKLVEKAAVGINALFSGALCCRAPRLDHGDEEAGMFLDQFGKRSMRAANFEKAPFRRQNGANLGKIIAREPLVFQGRFLRRGVAVEIH